MLLSEDGDPREAKRQFEEAIREHPEDPAAHFQRGMLLLRAEPSEAATDFQAALARDNRNAELHNEFGLALAGEGRVETAIDEFRTAI